MSRALFLTDMNELEQQTRLFMIVYICLGLVQVRFCITVDNSMQMCAVCLREGGFAVAGETMKARLRIAVLNSL